MTCAAEAHAAKNSKRKIPRSAPARFYAYFVTEYPEGTLAEDGTFVSGGHFQRAEYRRGVKVA